MGRRITGRYVLCDPLGSGESATVYLATDLVEEREVALKLASDAEEGTSAALRREFELLGHLRHPNLPAVFDFGWDDGLDRCFFTMEVIDLVGETDVEAIAQAVSRCVARATGPAEPFESDPMARAIPGHLPDRLVPDPAGYFVIYPTKASGCIK